MSATTVSFADSRHIESVVASESELARVFAVEVVTGEWRFGELLAEILADLGEVPRGIDDRNALAAEQYIEAIPCVEARQLDFSGFVMVVDLDLVAPVSQRIHQGAPSTVQTAHAAVNPSGHVS